MCGLATVVMWVSQGITERGCYVVLALFENYSFLVPWSQRSPSMSWLFGIWFPMMRPGDAQ